MVKGARSKAVRFAQWSFNMRDVRMNSESLMRLLFGRAVIGFNMLNVRMDSERKQKFSS